VPLFLSQIHRTTKMEEVQQLSTQQPTDSILKNTDVARHSVLAFLQTSKSFSQTMSYCKDLGLCVPWNELFQHFVTTRSPFSNHAQKTWSRELGLFLNEFGSVAAKGTKLHSARQRVAQAHCPHCWTFVSSRSNSLLVAQEIVRDSQLRVPEDQRTHKPESTGTPVKRKRRQEETRKHTGTSDRWCEQGVKVRGREMI
jgi:hypothetical protein